MYVQFGTYINISEVVFFDNADRLFDLETTRHGGLEMFDDKHRIIQIGATSDLFKFENLINPGAPWPEILS